MALLALVSAWGAITSAIPQTARLAVVLELDGAVSPAMVDYVTRGFRRADDRGARIIVLRMNTPGGLDTSMRKIIHAILASPVPVAAFVAPSGARAASAGTYILYASHIAAMAPGTNLGAATPIALGGGGFPFGGDEDSDGDGDPGDGGGETGDEGPSPRNAAEAKAVNDAAAYIRGLAELRGRNADWAESAVREAASLSSTAAARENIIDFTATNVEDLLAQANGLVVQVDQSDQRIDTTGLSVEAIEPDWRTRLLSVITDPNIALIFMMIGIYGLIFEFLNPGALVPGTVGGISLLIGLYALAVLPVSYAGVALLVVGAGLIVAEALAPSFGILGIGGGIAFLLGATILFDADVPGMQVSLPVLGAVAVVSLGFSLLVARLALTSRRREVATGGEEMIGAIGKVDNWQGDHGHILVHGERWKAVSGGPLVTGEEVEVVGRDGLTLKIAVRGTREP